MYLHAEIMMFQRMLRSNSRKPKMSKGRPTIAPTTVAVSKRPTIMKTIPRMAAIRRPVRLRLKASNSQSALKRHRNQGVGLRVGLLLLVRAQAFSLKVRLPGRDRLAGRGRGRACAIPIRPGKHSATGKWWSSPHSLYDICFATMCAIHRINAGYVCALAQLGDAL